MKKFYFVALCAAVCAGILSSAPVQASVKYDAEFIYLGNGQWQVTNLGAKALKDIDSNQSFLCSDYDTGLGKPCTGGEELFIVHSDATLDGSSCVYIQGDGGPSGSWDTVPSDPSKRVCSTPPVDPPVTPPVGPPVDPPTVEICWLLPDGGTEQNVTWPQSYVADCVPPCG